MKRIALVIAASIAFSTVGVAFAAVVGIPEVDSANATMQLQPGTFKQRSCTGEDATKYATWRGSWKGNEVDVTPGSTDYVLTGTVDIRNVVWTVNLTTLRGLLRARIVLIDPATSAPIYAGALVLITQGRPQHDDTVQARGWIDARTYFEGMPDRGSLLANVEFRFAPTLAAQAEFGDAPPNFGYPDYSVTTNNQTC